MIAQFQQDYRIKKYSLFTPMLLLVVKITYHDITLHVPWYKKSLLYITNWIQDVSVYKFCLITFLEHRRVLRFGYWDVGSTRDRMEPPRNDVLYLFPRTSDVTIGWYLRWSIPAEKLSSKSILKYRNYFLLFYLEIKKK